MEREELLRLENIVKVYGDVRVLDGVSLSLKRGERVAVIGRSGAGKSTLLNIAGALDTATSGSVIFGGRHVKGRRMRTYRRDSVGFVFQDGCLIHELTALENVQTSVRLSRSGADAAEYLALVGLSDKGGSYPDKLSGGEARRVSLARALAKKPALLLLDEPTEALDGDTGGEILDLICELSERDGISVLMVTHNVPFARRMDRVFRLEEGKLSEV